MINVNKIIEIVENFAPPQLAEAWDNSGWQIRLGKDEVNNILICLSLTPAILSQAIENNCDLILTHHPLFFTEFKKVTPESISTQILFQAIKHDIQVYSAHTNLDKTQGGINDILCEKLGIIPEETIDEYVKIATLPEKISLDDFILKLKISLDIPKIKLINPANIKEIQKIAVCSGSGGEFLSSLKDVDIFITGDIKYHTALEAQNIIVIDAGHFETEKIILETLKNLLHQEAPNIIIAKETAPWIII